MKRRLIAVALIAVLICVGLGNTVACTPTPTTEYDLTISSTAGGSVTTPGEGSFTYDEGTMVYLEAEAQEGYYFVNWTGDVSTIANINVATTIITMTDDYEITANFEQIPPGQFALTVNSMAGGSVTVPGEGTFICSPGMVVGLVAEADEGYQFGNWTSDVSTIGNVTAAATTITMSDSYSITANFGVNPMVSALYRHTVGLTSNGTVVAVGFNDTGQCDVGGWTDIVQISAGSYHTVGLKDDGTVVVVGDNDQGQCDVGGWTDIVQISAGRWHTVGLESDGTVVAVGYNYDGRCDVGGWTDIIQVVASHVHTVGLKTDSTVVAVGDNSAGQRNVGGWTDTVYVAAGDWHTVGLKSDGTVVAVGNTGHGRCDVGGWTDIVQVAAGAWHTVGLKSDGTVVAVGDNSYGQCNVGGWTDIVQVAAGQLHTVGIKSDGTVVAVGNNVDGQCDVGGWDLI